MVRRKVLVVLVMAGVIGCWWLAEAVSQQGGGNEGQPGGEARQRGGRSGGSTGAPNQRMEQFRQRAQEQMREQLGATEEEWQVLQPRIEKVQQLQRGTRGGFGGWGGQFGGRGGRRPEEARRPEGAPEHEQSEVEKKTEALRNLLADKASDAEAIRAALDALRKAREQAQQELVAARKELRDVVTVRQEASLVLMGILD